MPRSRGHLVLLGLCGAAVAADALLVTSTAVRAGIASAALAATLLLALAGRRDRLRGELTPNAQPRLRPRRRQRRSWLPELAGELARTSEQLATQQQQLTALSNRLERQQLELGSLQRKHEQRLQLETSSHQELARLSKARQQQQRTLERLQTTIANHNEQLGLLLQDELVEPRQ